MTVYILCFVLFLVGLYGVITRRNLIKIAISLSIMEFSIFLILVLIGYIDNGLAPIVDPGIGGIVLAKIRCGNCGQMISSRARACPFCGTAVPERATLGVPSRDVPEDRLVPCDDCGRMISVRAAACPHCGAPRKGASRTVSAARPDWGFEWRSKAEFLGYAQGSQIDLF